MDLAAGTVHRYSVQVGRATGPDLPVSFDQGRHVALGSRPGSWIAAAFRLPAGAHRAQIAAAWHAVIARHGTLSTEFAPPAASGSADDAGRPTLTPVEILPGSWTEVGVDAGEDPREALRREFDAACDPYAAPSYALTVVEPTTAVDSAGPRDGHPTAVIGFDHAHVDAWSLLVVARDFSACLADIIAGRAPGEALPSAAPFARHTAELAARPPAPAHVQRRWDEIMAAGAGEMPVFPLPLGDISAPRAEVVDDYFVLDPEGVDSLAERAREAGTRMLAVAIAEMTASFRAFGADSLRAVFPVHSRHRSEWHDSVGWFITNSVLENNSTDPATAGQRVKEAIALGDYPLQPLLRRWGGMPHTPGMFAISWLDHRRLPVALDKNLEPQHVSARIRTTGVMIWFVVNDAGLSMRCRYPDTPEARTCVDAWLRSLRAGLQRAAAPALR